MHVAGHKQRPPLHPQERWFLAIVLLQLIFLPWAFGTMHVWSQAIALGLSALGFVVALWPRVYEGDHAVAFGAGSRELGAQSTTHGPQVSASAGKSSAFSFQPALNNDPGPG